MRCPKGSCCVPGVSCLLAGICAVFWELTRVLGGGLTPCPRGLCHIRGVSHCVPAVSSPCPPCPQMPLDSSTLPEAERKARLRRHFPSKRKAKEEEIFEGIDLDTYKKFWKK